MKVDKTIWKAWKKFFVPENIYYDAKEIGMDHRTLKKAIDSGECYKPTHDKINDYIAKKEIEKLSHIKPSANGNGVNTNT